MGMADTIRNRLTAALGPCEVEVIDESSLHAGHAGARPGGETHFRVTVVAAAFEGQTRLERQRRVNHILRDELAGSIHALALKTLTPGEAARRKKEG